MTITSPVTEQPSPLSPAVVAQLRAACGGALHLPGEAGYDAARAAWQATVDQRPAAVAYPACPGEVGSLVRIAAGAGIRVAAQSTGHNASPLPALDDVLLVRTSALTEVTVDPVARRARAQAGALWEDVVGAAAAHGLAALHGSSPDVGVTGYSLGGGMGWYARQHGLQTNHVTAVELVTATGDLVRADADHLPDLFWALRGGGGNFGVVTALEFELFEITDAYAGWLVWDWHEAARVLPAWVEWTRTAPDAVTTSFRILQLPPLDSVPAPLRGRQVVAIDGAVLGDDATAAQILAPLRALSPELDMFARMPAPALCRLHGDPEGPTPVVSDSAVVHDVPEGDVAAFTAAFVAAAGAASGSSLLLAELRQLGGALSRPAPSAGAMATLPGAFVLFGAGVPMAPGSEEIILEHAARLVAACRPWTSQRQYLNFAERPVDAATGFDPAVYARLAEVRATYDPARVFMANHGIR